MLRPFAGSFRTDDEYVASKGDLMNASDLLVQCLEEEGIEYIFGVPGEENADFMMALEKSKEIKKCCY